jgi:hypothetical protein
MVTRLIAKLLRKKLYKGEVVMASDSFTATNYSDSITDVLRWTLHGIYESATFGEEGTVKTPSTDIFGKVCEFKLLHITKSSIGFFCYSRPRNEDVMFMSGRMVYIPETVLKMAKRGDFDIHSNFQK